MEANKRTAHTRKSQDVITIREKSFSDSFDRKLLFVINDSVFALRENMRETRDNTHTHIIIREIVETNPEDNFCFFLL